MYAFKHTAPRAPLSSSVAWDQQKNHMRAAIATDVSLVEIAGNALPTQAQPNLPKGLARKSYLFVYAELVDLVNHRANETEAH